MRKLKRLEHIFGILRAPGQIPRTARYSPGGTQYGRGVFTKQSKTMFPENVYASHINKKFREVSNFPTRSYLSVTAKLVTLSLYEEHVPFHIQDTVGSM